MRPYEKQILDQRLKDFQYEVIPNELLPFLPCLIQEDKEVIEAEQTNRGPIKATTVLVDRLKRRQKGFQDFVKALRKCGSEHTALLLDPNYNFRDDDDDEQTADPDGSGLGFRRIGTAIDVAISGNLLPEECEESTESYCALEHNVAERFGDQKSAENRRMRKEFQKHLPKGAAFVKTSKGSIILTFRLSSEQAANELWNMYTEGEFQSMVQTVFVQDALKDSHKDGLEKTPKLELSLCVERFNKIREKLKEIESEQESDSFLSFPRQPENGRVEDSDPEMEFIIPEVFLGDKANDLGPGELELREYQKELAEPAIKGKNTIICAPTNSGKTYVAIEIAKRHLERFDSDSEQSASSNTNRKEGRVVFIVSTVNLVLQQKDRFAYFLAGKYSVGEISGANSTDIPLKYLLQSNNVVVMTAQILVNALNSKNKEERVELKDISLLLFDECHHAHKEHPYNNIMEKYLALQAQPGYQHSLPQIVGLTASLGTGKASSVDRAEEHIILVSANLDAEAISTVRKNQAELKKYANVPERATHHVEKNKQDPFEKIVSKVMVQIEGRLKKMRGKSFKAGPPDKGSQQYRQWVEEFYKDAVAAGDRYLVTYTEHLREYHISLTLNSNTRMKNARSYLQKYFGSLDREKFTDIDEILEKLFYKAMEALDKFIEKNGGEPENPKLTRLKELLLENYKEFQNSDNGQHNQTNESREGDATSRESANENGQEKVGSKESAMNGDVEASKMSDDKVTEATESAGEVDRKTPGQEENARKDEDKRENMSLKTEQSATNTTERSSPDTAANQEEESGSEILCVNATNTAEGSSSEVLSDSPDESNSEALDDLKLDVTESSSSDTANEDDKAEQTKSRHHPEWEGPKGILFTRTRESTEALLDWIKETEELNKVLRPVLLVGSGDGKIGMTQNEQERVIKTFKTGEKNLLLATSVAEEGLDISDCNYVIRYDMMGNEISSVQSRGRVRAEYGKYSVLVGHSGARKRENMSAFREMLMTEALNKVQSLDPETFKKKVKELQQKSYRERYLKKHIYALSKSKHLPGDVTFLCRKCKETVCQAHDVRCIQGSHHVIINSDVRDTKVDIKNHPNPKKIDDIEMNKKIFCKNCGEDWGVTALISGVEWLCIKICSFVLEFPGKDQPRRMYKKWKDLPFGIKEASMEEILKHSGEKGPGDDLLDFNFDD
ncbi:unnamed protein product [Porites evermanni]|uniref:RNA helicase n=1 Tax=Porites evermanni TaxID=104178 RepID=A0ABN8LNR3_9CNID|nr:unnamed protein product [Porites evermanni]